MGRIQRLLTHPSYRSALFSEPSFKLAKENLDLLYAAEEEGCLGAENGICVPVRKAGKRSAVMFVPGDTDSVGKVAEMLAIAVEERIRLAGEKYRSKGGTEDARALFARGLYYEGYISDMDLVDLADKFQIRTGWPVIAVIGQFGEGFSAKDLADVCNKLSGNRVILSEAVRTDQQLLLIEAQKKDQTLLRDYKFDIASEIQAFLQYLRQREVPYRFAVGSWQKSAADLPKAVRHARWLLREIPDTDRTAWFYDYLDEYFLSCVVYEELTMTFWLPDQILDQKQKRSYLELFAALSEENFNLDRAAGRLHMHKNTLAYRLGKLRERFGMNPLINMRDRAFMTKYYHYLRKEMRY